MSTITRVNGSTYFDDTYGNGSNVWDEIDIEINNLVSTVNSIDNGNIANTPKIDGAKLDLTAGGYVVDAGDEMTGTLEHVFDGIWRKMRSDSNARLYEGNADVLWCLSYNTEYSSGAWQGRDKTGICLKFTMEGNGMYMYHAVSAGVGVVPTWVEIFRVDTAGINALRTHITSFAVVSERTYSEGDDIIISNDAESTAPTYYTSMTKHKEIRLSDLIIGTVTLRIKFSLHTENVNATAYGRIYKNGSPFGTVRANTSITAIEYSEDLTFVAGDLIQIYAYSSSSNVDRQAVVSNFRVSINDETEDYYNRNTLVSL